MNHLAFILVAAVALCSAAPLACPCKNAYSTFQTQFARPTTDTAEYVYRCNIFCENMDAIEQHNSNPASTYKVRVKALHDLTSEERVRQLHFGYRPGPRDKSRDTFATVADFPDHNPAQDSANWFLQDRVTDIRDQGQCGDCWAESATGVLESAYAQQTGMLTQLSVQQAAECPGGFEHDEGCSGGWPIDVFTYVKNQSGGLCTEAAYPTTIGSGMDVPCNATLMSNCTQSIRINQIMSIPTGNETLLLYAVQSDVVSVAIDASGMGFYSYADGVYDGTFNNQTDCSQTALDHAVIATGYGTFLNGTIPFYILRNSWGSDAWGALNGYILFKRNVNTCGIATDATFITF